MAYTVGSIFGISKKNEVLLMTIISICYNLFDMSLFQLSSNMEKIWSLDMDGDIFSEITQHNLKSFISVVVIIRSFTLHLYTTLSIALLWPAIYNEKAGICIPWLVISGIKNMGTSLMSCAAGLFICASYGGYRPACLIFSLAQVWDIVPSLYMWAVVLSLYREMKKPRPADIALAEKIEEMEMLMAVKRRKVRSMTTEEVLRKQIESRRKFSGTSALGLEDFCKVGSFENVDKGSRSLDSLLEGMANNEFMDAEEEIEQPELEDGLTPSQKTKKLLGITESQINLAKLERMTAKEDFPRMKIKHAKTTRISDPATACPCKSKPSTSTKTPNKLYAESTLYTVSQKLIRPVKSELKSTKDYLRNQTPCEFLKAVPSKEVRIIPMHNLSTTTITKSVETKNESEVKKKVPKIYKSRLPRKITKIPVKIIADKTGEDINKIKNDKKSRKKIDTKSNKIDNLAKGGTQVITVLQNVFNSSESADSSETESKECNVYFIKKENISSDKNKIRKILVNKPKKQLSLLHNTLHERNADTDISIKHNRNSTNYILPTINLSGSDDSDDFTSTEELLNDSLKNMFRKVCLSQQIIENDRTDAKKLPIIISLKEPERRYHQNIFNFSANFSRFSSTMPHELFNFDEGFNLKTNPVQSKENVLKSKEHKLDISLKSNSYVDSNYKTISSSFNMETIKSPSELSIDSSIRHLDITENDLQLNNKSDSYKKSSNLFHLVNIQDKLLKSNNLNINIEDSYEMYKDFISSVLTDNNFFKIKSNILLHKREETKKSKLKSKSLGRIYRKISNKYVDRSEESHSSISDENFADLDNEYYSLNTIDIKNGEVLMQDNSSKEHSTYAEAPSAENLFLTDDLKCYPEHSVCKEGIIIITTSKQNVLHTNEQINKDNLPKNNTNGKEITHFEIESGLGNSLDSSSLDKISLDTPNRNIYTTSINVYYHNDKLNTSDLEENSFKEYQTENRLESQLIQESNDQETHENSSNINVDDIEINIDPQDEDVNENRIGSEKLNHDLDVETTSKNKLLDDIEEQLSIKNEVAEQNSNQQSKEITVKYSKDNLNEKLNTSNHKFDLQSAISLIENLHDPTIQQLCSKLLLATREENKCPKDVNKLVHSVHSGRSLIKNEICKKSLQNSVLTKKLLPQINIYNPNVVQSSTENVVPKKTFIFKKEKSNIKIPRPLKQKPDINAKEFSCQTNTLSRKILNSPPQEITKKFKQKIGKEYNITNKHRGSELVKETIDTSLLVSKVIVNDKKDSSQNLPENKKEEVIIITAYTNKLSRTNSSKENYSFQRMKLKKSKTTK